MASGATGYAMFLPDGRHNLIVHNTLTASEHGFAVGGDRNVVRGNVVTRSGGSIDILDGARSTRVEHNRLSRVGDGIGVGIASGTVIEHNVVNRTGGPGHAGFGIGLGDSAGSTVAHNTIHANGPVSAIGIHHFKGDPLPQNNRIIGNVATSTTTDAIRVDPGAVATVLAGNLAVHSADDGIDVRAPGTTVTRNTANNNHDLGISAVAGVIDGGGNRAAGNGNPAQCTNISCR
jgi:hypothetical protein